MKKTVLRDTLLVAASILAQSPAAFAQEATPQGDPESGQSSKSQLEEIVVTGTRASLEHAEQVKREANVILDGVSADDISALPDASISDSLVRIAGISSNDNPRGPNAISIRGLGPDLTVVTVNGRLLPTASGGDRRMDLAQLPSEGLSGAYVLKTPDAKTLEGGVAGVLDLRTIHPLTAERQGLTVVGRAQLHDVSAALSEARHYSDVGARTEVSYVDSLSERLAVSVNYSFLKQDSGFAGAQVDNWRLGLGTRADVNGDSVPDAIPTNVGVTSNFNDDTRHSALSMVQWQPSDTVLVTLDGLYVTDDFYTGPNRFFANNVHNGALGAATSASVDESNSTQAFSGAVALYRNPNNDQRRVDKTYGGGLNIAVDNFGPLAAEFDFSFYRADRRTHSLQAVVENDAATAAGQRLPFSYDISDPENFVLGFQPLSAEDFALSTLNDGVDEAQDEITAARADFTYAPRTSGLLESIGFGLRLDRRDHSTASDDSQYSWATLAARPDLDSSFLQLERNPYAEIDEDFGGPGGVTFPYFDIFKLLELKTAPGAILSDLFANDIAGTYSNREDTGALYAQANLDFGKLHGNAGVRYVRTDTTTRGQSGTTSANVTSLKFDNTYDYVLPQMNLKYEVTPTLLARVAYTETFARQRFVDLAVSSAVDLTTVPSGVLTITRGNPNLEPFTSEGYDVSIEWSPSRSTNVALAGYWKDVRNFLVNSTENTTVTLTDGTVVPATIVTTINDPTKRYLRGVELSARRDLDFLPGTFRNIGAQFNLTYNETDIQQTVASLVGTTAPSSPDQFSDFVFNGQLYYSTPRLDLRLAYRSFDPYIRAFFGSYQEQPDGQLDFSGGWTIWENFRLIGSVTNVLGARMRRYVVDSRDADNERLTQLSVYQGRVMSIGLRMQF